MRLGLPFVLGVDELVDENPIQRIAVPAQDIEGVLSGFTRDHVVDPYCCLIHELSRSRRVSTTDDRTKEHYE